MEEPTVSSVEGVPHGLMSDPWREFPDVDIEFPGDRGNEKGILYDGPGIFRVHCDGLNDYVWGAPYRQVQNIVNALINAPQAVTMEDGRIEFQRQTLLTIKEVPSLSELTVTLGAGNMPVAYGQRRRLSVEDRMKEEAELIAQGPEPIFDICAVEPHDVADYLDAHFPSYCGPLKLVMFQTRAEVKMVDTRTSLLGKVSTYEIWQRDPGSYEIGSPEITIETKRWRAFLVDHLQRTRKPVLIDDGVCSYIVAGYRELDPEEDEHPKQYRVLDALYGSRYALRGPIRKFKPDEPNQYGNDVQKDCWVPAEWVEEGRGIHNIYVPGPMWMVLFIG